MVSVFSFSSWLCHSSIGNRNRQPSSPLVIMNCSPNPRFLPFLEFHLSPTIHFLPHPLTLTLLPTYFCIHHNHSFSHFYPLFLLTLLASIYAPNLSLLPQANSHHPTHLTLPNHNQNKHISIGIIPLTPIILHLLFKHFYNNHRYCDSY